jgi:hypothetical protein
MSSTKICAKCNVIKTLDEFYKDNRTQDGYRNRCKECDKLYRRQYYVGNCETIKAKARIKHSENKDQDAARSKRYYESHREEILLKAKNYEAQNRDKINSRRSQQYHNDINFKLGKNLRRRMLEAVNGNQNVSLSILGCNLSFFKRWIEFQFNETFSWDNYGQTWHIDHVKPCKSFNLKNEAERLSCFNWRNLRPVSKAENLSKAAKIDVELMLNQEKKVNEFFALINREVDGGSETRQSNPLPETPNILAPPQGFRKLELVIISAPEVSA